MMAADDQILQTLLLPKSGPGEVPMDCSQYLPSNVDPEEAANEGVNLTYPSSQLRSKTTDGSLLDPDALRRLSISTISSAGRSRGQSPFPYVDPTTERRSWRTVFWNFWKRYQGLILVTVSQLFGALMNVTTRLLEHEGGGLHPFQILFARMSLTIIFCCAWMWTQKVPDFPFGAKGIRWLLVARGLTGFFGIYGMYFSLQYLPVADAVVITFLAPSLASYGCYLFLHEPFPRSAQYASLVSLLGVVLIARPTSFFSSSPSARHSSLPSNQSNTTIPHFSSSSFPTPTSAQRFSAVAVAMLGVMGSAGAFTSIRWIGSRAHPLLSVNYFAVWCTVVSTLCLSLAQPLHFSPTLKFALPHGLRQWSMLLFLGVCGFVMQFLLTKGLAVGGKGHGAKATNMIYTNMLFALALDKVVFGQTPGWWSLAGGGLILGSAVFVALRKEQVKEQGQRGVGDGSDEEMVVHGTDDERDGMWIGEDGGEAAAEEVQLREFSR